MSVGVVFISMPPIKRLTLLALKTHPKEYKWKFTVNVLLFGFLSWKSFIEKIEKLFNLKIPEARFSLTPSKIEYPVSHTRNPTKA